MQIGGSSNRHSTSNKLLFKWLKCLMSGLNVFWKFLNLIQWTRRNIKEMNGITSKIKPISILRKFPSNSWNLILIRQPEAKFFFGNSSAGREKKKVNARRMTKRDKHCATADEPSGFSSSAFTTFLLFRGSVQWGATVPPSGRGAFRFSKFSRPAPGFCTSRTSSPASSRRERKKTFLFLHSD